jgi:NRPS condensation-like uncharacterized protein
MRLTPFEEYMFLDDRPDHPMWITVFCTLSGNVDRKKFDLALQIAIVRHPLLVASVRRGKRGRRDWDYSDTTSIASAFHVEWLNSLQTPDSPEKEECGVDRISHLDVSLLHGAKINLVNGPHFLIRGRERNGKVELAFLYHHSSADAAGFTSFLHDWWKTYDQLCRGEQPEPGSLGDAKRKLINRTKLGYGLRRRLRMHYASIRFPDGLKQFLFHHPWTLAAMRENKGTDPGKDALAFTSPFPSVVTTDLTADQFDAYRQKAKTLGVTLNDLLLRDHFLAIHEWRERRGGFPSDNGWIRIAVPINLRTDFHNDVPASNIVCMIFLDQRPEGLKDPAFLLRDLQRQMNLIKRYDMGQLFLSSLKTARNIPGGLHWFLEPPSCMATSCLTNIGSFLNQSPLRSSDDGKVRFGKAVLEDILILPPVRPLTMNSTSVIHYAGGFRISSTYDPQHISQDDAVDFLNTFVHSIDQTITSALSRF